MTNTHKVFSKIDDKTSRKHWRTQFKEDIPQKMTRQTENIEYWQWRDPHAFVEAEAKLNNSMCLVYTLPVFCTVQLISLVLQVICETDIVRLVYISFMILWKILCCYVLLISDMFPMEYAHQDLYCWCDWVLILPWPGAGCSSLSKCWGGSSAPRWTSGWCWFSLGLILQVLLHVPAK